ncbi:MAG: hypothetical protein M1812_002185 [Candelaria pacifica]|nr:MAG: hypothetical protein M1812_002185 [Candelaria pacifica]
MTLKRSFGFRQETAHQRKRKSQILRMSNISKVQSRTLDPLDKIPADTGQKAQSLLGSSNSHVYSVTDNGDLILIVRHQSSGEEGSYRVDTRCIRDTSSYFDRLLHPEKFSEGGAVTMAQQILRGKYAESSLVPRDELPQITIIDVGQTSEVNLFEEVLMDLLRILHNLEIKPGRPSTSYLANITIVADRFEALPVVADYIKRRKFLKRLDVKPKLLEGYRKAISEERLRQRLLIGSLLDYPNWVESASERLIIGSQQVKDPQGGVSRAADDAMWWDLPGCLEDELSYRRECILDTINSLQLHFVQLYTSKARQCKLGYDSSAQCDSFQLGEMIRFFTRMGTMRFQGLIHDTSEAAEPYGGDIQQLLENLRQCPSYQIDRNHTHCGLRVRLLPALTCIQRWIDYGARICGTSRENNRGTYAWTKYEKVAKWRFLEVPNFGQTKESIMSRGSSCNSIHNGSRELFTAKERDWTPSDT